MWFIAVGAEVLRADRIQERTYQTQLAEEARRANSLLVLPTGLGKTVIACLVIAAKVAESGGRALILAPSRPLADQHRRTMESFLEAGPVALLTGSESPRRRGTLWRGRQLLSATPQTAINDAKRGFVPSDLSVVVFDEAHRAVGDYSYVEFAAWLRINCPDSLVLGLTASPGHEIEHIEEVCRNLGISQVLIRTRDDPDVAPYVAPVEVGWIEVQPSDVILKIASYLTKRLHESLNKLRRYGFLRDRKNVQVRIQDLNAVAAQIFARRQAGDRKPYLFQASRQLSLARMAMHAANTVQREGVDAFRKFVAPKLGPTRGKTDASFVNDDRVARAVKLAAKWKGATHPKIEPLVRLLKEGPEAGWKVIVFAELRDTVDFLVGLSREQGVRAERFTGQGTRDGRKGMTQAQQRAILGQFSAGEFPVLCATSIAEEGLDIPQVDMVIFFEPVASDIRLIQRSGRTGRDAPGRVVILTTDRSLDERYLWSGLKREKRMKRLVRKLAVAGIEGFARSPPPPAAPPKARVTQSTFDRFS